MNFAHLHVHTQYSILDALSSIKDLFNRAEELEMPAIAITDHGNMYGVKEFLEQAQKHPSVKPIVGCEVYVSKGDHRKQERDCCHLVLLAKNLEGYHNLVKIVSEANVNGFYYKPRISREFIEDHRAGLICTSACADGEVPRALIAHDYDTAEKAVLWYKQVFGDDFYLEVMKHKTELSELSDERYEQQCDYCKELFRLAAKHGVKVIATNDVHFVRKEDGSAHDRFLCLEANSYIDDPYRRRYTRQEYLKTKDEMLSLFPDHPEALDNTMEIVEKVERYSIDRDIQMPVFEIDPAFLKEIDKYTKKYKSIIAESQNDEQGDYRGDHFSHTAAYLSHLTFEGAKERYGEVLTEECRERLEYELQVICRKGCQDYFLFIQDVVSGVRAMGSMVAGRGSSAGSAVAYCLGITGIDPIKYKLLFERFLNPDQMSLPNIDIDYEDDKLARRYIEKKYGKDYVAGVITFATLSAKTAIEAVGRISHLPEKEIKRLQNMLPDYEQARNLGFVPSKNKILDVCFQSVPEIKNEVENGMEACRDVLKYARSLEGCIYRTGVHCCALAISQKALSDNVPLCIFRAGKENESCIVTQYDEHYIEDVGLLKINALGLSYLSTIHNCIDLIKERHGVSIDIRSIPLNDRETYELYSRGDTQGVFCFECEGIKTYLKALQPNCFEDLVAMHSLYRPGSMERILEYIERKRGKAPIAYALPEMEEFLCDTYGIPIYQEQYMLLSMKLASFNKTEADLLRRAFGKRQKSILLTLKDKFLSGGAANGLPSDALEKIWNEWEQYCSNSIIRAHSSCYVWLSYLTAWLKCHYTSEFYLSSIMNSKWPENTQALIADCSEHGIEVIKPDVNS